MKNLFLSLIVISLLFSCSEKKESTKKDEVVTGETLFKQTCAKCHELPNPANLTKDKIEHELQVHKDKERLTSLSAENFQKLHDYLVNQVSK